MVDNPTNALALSLPDIMRAPGQPVNVPSDSATGGIPLRLLNTAATAVTVTSVSFALSYDPSLLTVGSTCILPAASGLPADATATVDTSTPGLAVVTFTASDGVVLGAGQGLNFLNLTATVPVTAPYGADEVLDLQNIAINGGSIPALADDAVHVAGLVGDATGAMDYNAVDALRIAQVAVDLASGFSAWPLVDPTIIADVLSTGQLSGLDGLEVAKQAVGLGNGNVPQVPAPSATSTTLAASADALLVGQSVTLTATVAGTGALPTGTVMFLDGSSVLGTADVNEDCLATFSTSALAAGSHALTAVYDGDPFNTGSISTVLPEIVVQASSVTLATSAASTTVGASVTFTATVAAASGPEVPTGTVTFEDGGFSIGTAGLNSGTATFATSSLDVAGSPHTITAAYSGDTNFAGSTGTLPGSQTITAPSATTVTPGSVTTIATIPTTDEESDDDQSCTTWTWIGTGTTNNFWNNSANWSGTSTGTIPANGDDVIFLSGVTSCDNVANLTLNSITISAPTTISVGANCTLFVTGNIACGNAPLTIADAGSVFISGLISGNGSLTKTGSGTLTLSAPTPTAAAPSSLTVPCAWGATAQSPATCSSTVPWVSACCPSTTTVRRICRMTATPVRWPTA